MVALRDLQLDVRRVVKNIQRVFSTASDLSTAEAEQLHTLFIACIEEVNARLRRCDELLRRGLRQEALQECESGPSLLDLVTELDLPEWEAWAHYASQYGLSEPPSLLIEVASELNAEFTTAASLDSLLRKHRLQALARSPLSARLSLLRTIAERDPGNHAWKEDLTAYEAARLKQVGAEFRQRFEAKDLVGVEALRRELENSRWQTAPPSSIVDPIVRGHMQLVREDARRRLVRLAQAIDQQFAAFDLPALEMSHEQWQRYAALSGLTDKDSLAAQVDQAFAWLAQEHAAAAGAQEFQSALANFEFALDDSTTSRHELGRLRTIVERFDQPIPERILRRCDERQRALIRAEQQRFRLTVLGVGTGIALAGGLLWLVIAWQISNRELRNAETTLRRLVAEKAFLQAQETLERLPVSIRQSAVVAGLADEVARRLREESARKERFFAQLKAAQAGLVDTWESVQRTQDKLDAVRTIAAGEDEMAALAEVEGELFVVRDQLQDNADERFLKECRDLAEQLRELEALDESAVHLHLATADSLARRAFVSQTARQNGQIELIVARLKSRMEAIQSTATERAARGRVVAAIGRESEFRAALEDYLQKGFAGPRAIDFRRSLDEAAPTLPLLAAWNRFAGSWPEDAWNTPDRAQTLLDLLAAPGELAEWGVIARAAAERPYLESVTRRAPGPDSLWRDLQVWLEKEWMALHCVRRKDEDLVYFSELPGDPITRNQVTFFQIKERVSVLDPEKIKNRPVYLTDLLPFKDDRYVLPSPQRLFVEKARPRIDAMRNPKQSPSYEEQALDLLGMWNQQAGLDPVLKMLYLQTFQVVLVQGSTVLEEALRPLERALETNETLVAVNWLDRDDAEVRSVRKSMQQKLAEINAQLFGPDSLRPTVLAGVEKARNNLRQPQKYAWVGLLMKDDTGAWQCLGPTSDQTGPQAELRLFQPSASPDDRFPVIGARGPDGPQWNDEALPLLYEGCPVLSVE